MPEENWFDNRGAERAMFDRVVKAVAVNAEVVLGDAQRNAPVETGYLRGSGQVAPREEIVPLPDAPTMIEETVEFTAVYAAAQEVNDAYEHPKGGHAHFLGDSVKAHAAGLQASVDAAAKL